jgi:hypothetical protein
MRHSGNLARFVNDRQNKCFQPRSIAAESRLFSPGDGPAVGIQNQVMNLFSRSWGEAEIFVESPRLARNFITGLTRRNFQRQVFVVIGNNCD